MYNYKIVMVSGKEYDILTKIEDLTGFLTSLYGNNVAIPFVSIHKISYKDVDSNEMCAIVSTYIQSVEYRGVINGN